MLALGILCQDSHTNRTSSIQMGQASMTGSRCRTKGHSYVTRATIRHWSLLCVGNWTWTAGSAVKIKVAFHTLINKVEAGSIPRGLVAGKDVRWLDAGVGSSRYHGVWCGTGLG